MKTSIPPLLITLTLVCFGLLPKVQAVSPPPPGGYPNFTTAAGDHALQALTMGLGNTALGTFSLFSVTTGSFNTAVGAGSLDLNTADENTATGAAALLFNTTGSENTANGAAALEFNETGDRNTAVGAFALFSNTSGGSNTATGDSALFANSTGHDNTATGIAALGSNIDGVRNTAVGSLALQSNTSGSDNIAIGLQAGSALTTAESQNIDIGNDGVAGENSAIRIGGPLQTKTFIAGIHGVSEGGMGILPVFINSAGQLGTSASSRRFKKEIQPMDTTSEVILQLKPVTFHYRNDNASTPQFGLIAEEVAEVNPDLVVRDKDGQIYTVRYEAVNAMLLNEFLKEHKTVQEQGAMIARQQKAIEALTAGLQKVSAQFEVNKPAPQTVLNDN